MRLHVVLTAICRPQGIPWRQLALDPEKTIINIGETAPNPSNLHNLCSTAPAFDNRSSYRQRIE